MSIPTPTPAQAGFIVRLCLGLERDAGTEASAAATSIRTGLHLDAYDLSASARIEAVVQARVAQQTQALAERSAQEQKVDTKSQGPQV